MWKAGKQEEEMIYLELRKSGREDGLSGVQGVGLVRSCFPEFQILQVFRTIEIGCGRPENWKGR
jgi:hypothetical protein